MLYHHRLWGLRHVNCQAYKSELTEFIELVQAGRDSELHRLEQKAMLRHPNVVRTTIAAEMSWKQGNTMEIAKDWVWVPWVTDVVRVGPGENQSGTLGKQDLNSMQLQKILVSVLIRNYPVVFSCFSPWFSCIFHFPSVPFVPSFRPCLLSRAGAGRFLVDQDAGWRGGHQSGWHAAPREAPAPWHRWGDETNIQQRYWQKKAKKRHTMST